MLRVRQATLDDLDTVVALRLALLREHAGNAIYGRLRADAPQRARMLFGAQIADTQRPGADEVMLLAERVRARTGRVVGILRCMESHGSPLLEPTRYGYVASVYVVPAARRHGVPLTVHAALGAEIIHQHPAANGAAIGDTSHRDFRRLAGSLPRLDDGGVVLNLGSAVIMPEVFLKALTIARNLGGGKPERFTSVDLDMQRHYRPRMNVVQRPTLHSGKGYEITGHHEIMVPLLVWAVVTELG